jgi:hypothetical protein
VGLMLIIGFLVLQLLSLALQLLLHTMEVGTGTLAYSCSSPLLLNHLLSHC